MVCKNFFSLNSIRLVAALAFTSALLNLPLTHVALAVTPPSAVNYCCRVSCPTGCCLVGVTVNCRQDCVNCESYIDSTLRDTITDTVTDENTDTQQHVTDLHNDSDASDRENTLRELVTLRHEQLRTFMYNSSNAEYDMYTDRILPVLTDFVAQMDSFMTAETASIGSFFDGQNHVQNQTALNRLKAKSHSAYNPDSDLCVFGTQAKALASSDSLAQYTRRILAAKSMDKDFYPLNTEDFSVPGISGTDYNARRKKFETVYCSQYDNGARLGDWCIAAEDTARQNSDIAYSRVLHGKQSLELDFFNATSEPDEEDVLALMNNLYAAEDLPRMSMEKLSGAQPERLLDLRALAAKRNVARASYSSLAGMKARGSGSSADYMYRFYQHMGIANPQEFEAMAGVEPSYYSQMDMLSKKIYQTPGFHTNLITNPENIKRQRASMQSVELMQQRDIFESVLRSEMLMSQLVELKLRKPQNKVSTDLKGLGK